MGSAIAENILVIAYRFPPMGGIGTRRWAKFAKYLARQGRRVHVLTTEYDWVDPVNWLHDISGNPNIVVHRCPSGIPAFALKTSKRLYERILTRLWAQYWIRGKYSLGSVEAWGPKMLVLAKKIIREHSIQKIVVTGPPCELFLLVAPLKTEFPHLRVILDYRDPWNTDRDYAYPEGVADLKRKLYLVGSERMALWLADAVVVVTQKMRDDLLAVFGVADSKLRVIYNGFDLDDYSALEVGRQTDVGYIMVYTGSLGVGDGRQNAIAMLGEAIERSADPWFRENLRIDLYSDLPSSYYRSSVHRFLREKVRCLPMVPPEEIVRKIAQADACISINHPKDAHAFGTKIFDYMALGKEIFHVSDGGELYQLLNRCGRLVARYDIDAISAMLAQLRQRLQFAQVHAEDVFMDFSVQRQTEEYIKVLDRL